MASKRIAVESRNEWMSSAATLLDLLRTSTANNPTTTSKCATTRKRRKVAQDQHGHDESLTQSQAANQLMDGNEDDHVQLATHGQLAASIDHEGYSRHQTWEPTMAIPSGSQYASGVERTDHYAVAMWAKMAVAREVFSSDLSRGLMDSRIRQQENLNVTDAIRLSMPPAEGDFLLSVWVSKDVGMSINDAISGPTRDLSGKLGPYLFDAMMQSFAIQREQARVSDVLRIKQDKKGFDAKLEIKICFATGKDLFQRMFPSN